MAFDTPPSSWADFSRRPIWRSLGVCRKPQRDHCDRCIEWRWLLVTLPRGRKVGLTSLHADSGGWSVFLLATSIQPHNMPRIGNGGHSALSNTMGLGADNVLQFKVSQPCCFDTLLDSTEQVVLANGSYVTASRCQNTDMFFALAGEPLPHGKGSFTQIV